MNLAIGQRERSHLGRKVTDEHLADTAASIVTDQIDCVDVSRCEKFSDHVRLPKVGDIRSRVDLRITQAHLIQRNAATDGCEVGHDIAPFVTVQWQAVQK